MMSPTPTHITFNAGLWAHRSLTSAQLKDAMDAAADITGSRRSVTWRESAPLFPTHGFMNYLKQPYFCAPY